MVSMSSDFYIPSDNDDLPMGWELAFIKDLCDFNPKHNRELSDDLEISFVPMSSVDGINGRIKAQEVKRLGELRKGYTHFTDGDVIFAKISPCMENGKVAVAKDLVNSIACGSTEFHVLRSQGAVLSEYLYCFLRQERYLYNAAHNMTGVVGQRRLPKDFLLDTEFRIPPLNEQMRIVEKVEALMLRSRKAKEALDAIPKLIQQFRQSVLAAAFRGDLTADWREQNNDQEWYPAKLADVIKEKPRNGYSPKPVDYPTSTKSLTLSATISGKFKPEYSKNIDELIPVDSYLWLYPDDILIQRSNTIGYVGTCAIYDCEPREFIYPDTMMKIQVVKEKVTTQFLYYQLSDETVRSYFRNNATGTAGNMPKINQQIVMNTPLAIPSLSEQEEIVSQIQASFKAIDKLKALHYSCFEDFSNLNQSILSKAFRGELVEQDPNDEPASVLLERIQKERAKEKVKQIGAKKTKKVEIEIPDLLGE